MEGEMTRDEILKLEANPETDALVAERVMGWEKIEIKYFGSDSTPRQNELEDWMHKVGLCYLGDYFIDIDRDFWIEVENWKPSTDIAAAWEVVKEMNAKGFWCYINLLSSQCRATFEFVKNRKRYTAYGGIDEESLAISRAALLTKLEA
jgi:hypothetical protein